MAEAASRLSSEIRQRHPDIPWADVIAFRNFVVHEYFAVDWSIIWYTATQDAPSLREQILSILSSDFAD